MMYPLRFIFQNEIYSVRRTTHAEHYQNENVLYAGLNEEANVLVVFRKMIPDPNSKIGEYMSDPVADERAATICPNDFVRIDFYDIQSREHLGWLQNNPGVAVLRKDSDATGRSFRLGYI
jgi:hypothetical protein